MTDYRDYETIRRATQRQVELHSYRTRGAAADILRSAGWTEAEINAVLILPLQTSFVPNGGGPKYKPPYEEPIVEMPPVQVNPHQPAQGTWNGVGWVGDRPLYSL